MVITKTTTNPNGKPQAVAFIPAFVEDNVLGLERDPQYIARLMARDETTAEALRYGKWSVFAGQMFRTFQKYTHTCAPLEIPKHWTRWRSIDWGFAAPWCCLWWAKDPDTRRLYVYRESYLAGLLDPQQAEKINDLSAGETISFTFADPSMWTKRTTDLIAKSTYDAYLAGGVLLTKADNDQRSKIAKTRASFGNIHDGRPAVMVFETCANLIRTIPAIMYDPKNAELPMDGQEDHAWDSYAYGLTNWVAPQPPVPPAKKNPNPYSKMKGM